MREPEEKLEHEFFVRIGRDGRSATGKEKGPAKYRSFWIFRSLSALAKAMP
jgi:hypothetical protein